MFLDVFFLADERIFIYRSPIIVTFQRIEIILLFLDRYFSCKLPSLLLSRPIIEIRRTGGQVRTVFVHNRHLVRSYAYAEYRPIVT